MSSSDEIRAVWSRVIDTANDILQQRREPHDGARELDQLYVELVRLEEALRPFVGLAAEWDYYADRREECERQILSAAETLRRNFGQ